MIILKKQSYQEKRTYLLENCDVLNYYERFVFTKLITVGFRIGVSQKLMTSALSKAKQIDEDILVYILIRNWDPNTISFLDIVLKENEPNFLSKPALFILPVLLKRTSRI